MTTPLRIGMGDFYALRITELKSAYFDPSVVTGAVMKVTKPGGASDAISWTADLVDQSSTSVTAVYTFAADGLDLDKAGSWKVWIQWTVPGFVIGPTSEPIAFPVIPANQIRV